jgi:hypothetical protein
LAPSKKFILLFNAQHWLDVGEKTISESEHYFCEIETAAVVRIFVPTEESQWLLFHSNLEPEKYKEI